MDAVSPSSSRARSPGCWCQRLETFARRLGAIDEPKERGLHDVPTPKLGGLAILVAIVGASLIWLPWNARRGAILAGATVITLVGAIDDVVDLPAAPKLLGQIGAALIPVLAGLRVDSTTLPSSAASSWAGSPTRRP